MFKVMKIINIFYIRKRCKWFINWHFYDLNGQMIKDYNICRNIQFGKEDKYLLTDSDNINKGFLTISNIEDQNNIMEIECDISGVTSRLLSDYKNIATMIDTDENNKSILIKDIETGDTIADISYVKKMINIPTFSFRLIKKKIIYFLGLLN